jgi:hypothetical protein
VEDEHDDTVEEDGDVSCREREGKKEAPWKVAIDSFSSPNGQRIPLPTSSRRWGRSAVADRPIHYPGP